MANSTNRNPIVLDTDEGTGPIRSGRIRVTSVVLSNADGVAPHSFILTDLTGGAAGTDEVINQQVPANTSVPVNVDGWWDGLDTALFSSATGNTVTIYIK